MAGFLRQVAVVAVVHSCEVAFGGVLVWAFWGIVACRPGATSPPMSATSSPTTTAAGREPQPRSRIPGSPCGAGCGTR